MPNISAGNRLYLYQLLSRELGVGRQTLLPRAEEALASDGVAPADLGCESMRELCEQLSEFIKLTVFKKGYVYVTVLACEEYDRALSQPAQGKADGNRPWKRRRGAKALRPVKPRHVEPEPVEPAEDGAAEVAETEIEPEAPTVAGPEAAVAEAEQESEAAEPEPTTASEPAPETSPDPEPAPEPEPETSPDPEPATKGTPHISLNITYDPDEGRAENVPAPVSPRSHTTRVDELPHDFHADLRCPNEQLSVLYQVLPPDVDPLGTLEEDFRVARSTGALGGTRSNVTFSLRYLRSDGTGPVRVTLRRTARAAGSKRWTLAQVDAGDTGKVGLAGLDDATRGPWSAFAARAGKGAPDPERTLAQTIALGSWDQALEQLAALAAPEDWGPGLRVLRGYLTMTFMSVRAQGKLSVADDGATADFDTGLLTTEGQPIYANLASRPGDIPWALEGFSVEGTAETARTEAPAGLLLFDPALSSPDVPGATALARNPRRSSAAYDPVADEVRLLVPDDDHACALAIEGGAYVRVADLALPDAYTCARVMGAEQPSWLRPQR